jgi:hypothetical protein
VPTSPAPLQDALARTAETHGHGPGPVGLVTEHGRGGPGYTTVVLRTAGGRTIVPGQNGIDLHDVLTSDPPFVATALAGG